MNIMGHTKLELDFRKVEEVDIHEKTRVIKKYVTKAGKKLYCEKFWEFIVCYMIWSLMMKIQMLQEMIQFFTNKNFIGNQIGDYCHGKFWKFPKFDLIFLRLSNY